jgi:hypothetical protein
MAVSLMNRRYKEVLKNIDFINTVPAQYRHYFLLELGRVIGMHLDAKNQTAALGSVAGKCSPALKAYLYRGLMDWSITYGCSDSRLKDSAKERCPSYFYRGISRGMWLRGFPSKKTISGWLKKFGVARENERYFYWGIMENLFKVNNIYEEGEINERIQTVISCNWIEKDMLCEGLGLSLGHLTFGYIKRFTGLLEPALSKEQLSRFYYGYCLSLKERYGLDVRKIKELIDANVDKRFTWFCYKIIWSPKINADIL